MRSVRLALLISAGCGGAEAAPLEPIASQQASAAVSEAPPPEPTPSAAAASASAVPTSTSAPLAGPLDLSPWGQPVLLDRLPGMVVSLEPNPNLLNAIVEADGGLELQVLKSFGKEPTAASQRKVIGSLLQNTRFVEEEQLANGFVIVWETDCAFGKKRETGFQLYDKKANHFCQSARICKTREEIAPLIKTCKSMRPKAVN